MPAISAGVRVGVPIRIDRIRSVSGRVRAAPTVCPANDSRASKWPSHFSRSGCYVKVVKDEAGGFGHAGPAKGELQLRETHDGYQEQRWITIERDGVEAQNNWREQ